MDCANEKLPKNECRITLFRRKQECLSYILTDLLTSLRQYCVQTLRKIFGLGCICTIQRKEDGLFFFSQVQSFKNGIAHPLRSECTDTESKGDYRFKVVNLHVAFARYAYSALYSHSLKTPLLQSAFTPARKVGVVTPNNSQISHSVMAVVPISFSMTMLPLLSVEIMFRFMASLGYGVHFRMMRSACFRIS